LGELKRGNGEREKNDLWLEGGAPPPPRFFVSVASKEVSVSVSPLE
jgi:hypothetical protein